MTKCLLVKWRQYALNAHQLCVLISVSAHVQSNWGGPLAGPPCASHRGLIGNRGKPQGWEGAGGLILAGATDFWGTEPFSVSQLHLAQDEDEAPGPASIISSHTIKQTGGVGWFLTCWAVTCHWPRVSIYLGDSATHKQLLVRDFQQLTFGCGLSKLGDQMMMW